MILGALWDPFGVHLGAKSVSKSRSKQKVEMHACFWEGPAAGAGSLYAEESEESDTDDSTRPPPRAEVRRILRLRPCRRPPFQQVTADKLNADMADLFGPKL